MQVWRRCNNIHIHTQQLRQARFQNNLDMSGQQVGPCSFKGSLGNRRSRKQSIICRQVTRKKLFEWGRTSLQKAFHFKFTTVTCDTRHSKNHIKKSSCKSSRTFFLPVGILQEPSMKKKKKSNRSSLTREDLDLWLQVKGTPYSNDHAWNTLPNKVIDVIMIIAVREWYLRYLEHYAHTQRDARIFFFCFVREWWCHLPPPSSAFQRSRRDCRRDFVVFHQTNRDLLCTSWSYYSVNINQLILLWLGRVKIPKLCLISDPCNHYIQVIGGRKRLIFDNKLVDVDVQGPIGGSPESLIPRRHEYSSWSWDHKIAIAPEITMPSNHREYGIWEVPFRSVGENRQSNGLKKIKKKKISDFCVSCHGCCGFFGGW